MKKKILLTCTFLALIVSCIANRPTAKDVVKDAGPALNVAQIACVFASQLTDSIAVAKACGIVDKLDVILPLVQDMIGQREGARKAGVAWGPRDAGAASDAQAVIQHDR